MLFASPAAAADKKPNIVIIWGDDVGQSNISDYSHGVMGYQTPNIMTFKEYPQRQKAASFNLNEVMDQLKESGGSK